MSFLDAGKKENSQKDLKLPTFSRTSSYINENALEAETSVFFRPKKTSNGHTAQARRSFRKAHTYLIGLNLRFTGTNQTDPPEKFKLL